VWSFFSVTREKNKTLKESIINKVKRETGIQLMAADFLLDMDLNGQDKHFYHSSLNDDNVNSMQRENGETLQFFAIKELSELNLTDATKYFVDTHNELIKKL